MVLITLACLKHVSLALHHDLLVRRDVYSVCVAVCVIVVLVVIQSKVTKKKRKQVVYRVCISE